MPDTQSHGMTTTEVVALVRTWLDDLHATHATITGPNHGEL